MKKGKKAPHFKLQYIEKRRSERTSENGKLALILGKEEPRE